MAPSEIRAQPPCFFQTADESKVFDDLQTILAIALAIIVCVGEAGLLSPAVMGGAVIGLATATGVVELITLLRDKSEKSATEKLVTVITAISTIALIILGSLVISDHVSPKAFSIIALGIDLTTLAIRVLAKRIYGPQEKRYSCFKSDPQF